MTSEKEGFSDPESEESDPLHFSSLSFLSDNEMHSAFTTARGKRLRMSLDSFNTANSSFESSPLLQKLQHLYSTALSKESNTDYFSLFNAFKWTYLKSRNTSDALVADTLLRYSLSSYSPLRRLSEKDEAPGVYLKVLVIQASLSSSSHTFHVTDGFYSVAVITDKHLQPLLKMGMVLDIFGYKSLLSAPTEIEELCSSNTPLLYLEYNGVKPTVKGSLGYQYHAAFIRSLYSIKKDGGIVGCIEITVIREVFTKYLININGVKNVVDKEEYSRTIEMLKKSISKVPNKERDISSMISIKRFVEYEIRDGRDGDERKGRYVLTLWNPPDLQLVGKRMQVFFLVPSDRKSNGCELSLTSIPQTKIKIREYQNNQSSSVR